MTQFIGWLDHRLTSEQSTALLQQFSAMGLSTQFAAQNIGLSHSQATVIESDHCLLLGFKPADNHVLQDGLKTYQQNSDYLALLAAKPSSWLLIDKTKSLIILASDPIGLNHIYYAQIAEGFVFASSADLILKHPAISDDIRLQTVYDYVYFHHCPSPNTIYQHIHKLEGGQCLVYQNNQMNLKQYWQPRFSEQLSGSIADAGQQLQNQLLNAVKNCVDNENNTGAFLSGGLDSSSVAGMLSNVYPAKAKTFTIGFPVAEYNETEYAHIASRHFNTLQHDYIIMPEDAVNAIPAIAAYYDEPFGNSSALATYYCAKFAKAHGVTRLLAGDGGDELFAGNERYAKQLLFDYYHCVPSVFAKGIESALNYLPNSLSKQKLFFKAKRYIEQAKISMPDRLQDYNFLHRHPLTDIFDTDFLAQVDIHIPLSQLQKTYYYPQQASTLNRMLYMDWKVTLHDNDLVKVNKMCEMAGIEVCYPFLENDMIEFSCQIPSSLKLKNQKLRWFYKQAMADFLPEKIITKSKHGFGLPFGVWLQNHQPLKDLAYGAVRQLKQRHYFKPDFLENAIQMHQSVHAAYYGELIWILMMLELWFQGKQR